MLHIKKVRLSKTRCGRSGFVPIKKMIAEQQIVFGEVYIPNMPDSHGEMMLPEDVENMAHNFLKEVQLGRSIDTAHDNWPNGSYPVESFIARNMPPYEDGAWVMGVKITDEKLWARIRKGELAGFSFEGRAKKQKAVVEIEYRPTQVGFTEPDPEDGHIHAFVIKMNEMGKVVGGTTSEVNGHSHTISRGTATDEAEKHRHRYFVQ